MGRKKNDRLVKRVQVTFTEEQYNLIQELKGQLGLNDSEVVRNIVISWFAEKSIISTILKKKISKGG